MLQKDVHCNEPTTPGHEDIILSPTGHLGSQTQVSIYDGNYLGTFSSDQDALAFAWNWMKENQFFPNVFIMSDHGNFHLIKTSELANE